MVISFKANAPNFVSTYKNARVIIDAPTSPTQIKGTVLTTGKNSPIQNATIEITGALSLKTQTNMDGNFTFRSIKPGAYKISVTAEGSTDTTTTNVEVKLGQTTKVEISVNS